MTEESVPKVTARVLGTEDSTPLEFWVAIEESCFLQLDDVVALERTLPDGRTIRIFGVVNQVRARHEGARFDSDVFLIESGVLPAQIAEAAQISVTRVEPEVFVPPIPGTPVRLAQNEERSMALFFDQMKQVIPAGLGRDGEPLFLNLEFLDGTRGAHVNISGVSGVATKTSYATFLLYSIFQSGAIASAPNTRALIFNVKGEDLLFLDEPNRILAEMPGQAERYSKLGLPATAFPQVEFWAPPRRDSNTAAPDISSRHRGVESFFWSLAEFCREDYLPFLFADSEDDRQHYTIVIHNVMAQLRKGEPLPDGGVMLEGQMVRTLPDLVDLIADRLQMNGTAIEWAGRAIGQGTINAFLRRLYGAVRHVRHLIRGDVPNPEAHAIRRQRQVTVVDIHNLNDRAQRFVVGVVLRKAFQEKERSGSPDPRWFVVLDELNKYAPREGWSPIKEILLEIAERGRSLGMILIGAQQTASEVERRIVSNSAIRVVGRLDTAEAGRSDYGWLPPTHRKRATVLKPGTMIVSQPELPIPLLVEFPFPAWATRPSETGSGSTDDAVLIERLFQEPEP